MVVIIGRAHPGKLWCGSQKMERGGGESRQQSRKKGYKILKLTASHMAPVVKNLPAKAGNSEIHTEKEKNG